ncbi:MAG: hypothetical protein LBI59_01950, partial [Candidatus Accumulibacter sp.]|nr:hypothetical protein [Accumulibacter sp.]
PGRCSNAKTGVQKLALASAKRIRDQKFMRRFAPGKEGKPCALKHSRGGKAAGNFLCFLFFVS